MFDWVGRTLDGIEEGLASASDFIWGPWLLIPLLLLTGVYLTGMLRGVQFTKLGYALWLALIKRKEPGAAGDISHYQALTVALAATVGVGNIAGVGTAIALGGPGALFWMWITGLVGMATKYAEAFLGVKYRRLDAKGEQSGGPQYYLSEGLRRHFGPGMARFGTVLAVLFAVFGAIAAFGIGNMVQSNSVADALHTEWSVAPWLTGLVLMLVAALVILGGIKMIGRFTAAFVPFMAIFYILGATVVLVLNADQLPGALQTIFNDAFTGTAAVGGFVGAGFLAALRWGVARGIFSNESGLGTGGIAAAAAKTTHEVRQALVSMTQTFLDTLVVVSFTGLTIVVTGAWQHVDAAGDALTGASLTAGAFREGLPGDQGGIIVSLGVVFFAFSTLLGWAYYGERCLERLFGVRPIGAYRVVFCLAIFAGAVFELGLVWTFADVLNGLMALPNLIGLILLSVLVAKGTRAFFERPDWKSVTEGRADPDDPDAPRERLEPV
ncbi:sodium:alanine symporter family protein [Natronosporangium hydrolyticum]|uniref:Sodium:alanine symporter family protein n=1 Tax=Natronosporangium hydrolyticum TaxID=2811111 RepID=A0A895YKW2_9ACTN|nr:sodium:alanine symporter family protein [Natronosporangium hydrolyticum]QSB16139.1 sodium:alanine symporter family protein [Natronosporangium hydrolyticum]